MDRDPQQPTPASPFLRLQGWWIVLALIGIWWFTPGVEGFLAVVQPSSDTGTWLTVNLYAQLLDILLLTGLLGYAGISIRALAGPPPQPGQLRDILLAFAFTFCAATPLYYLVFVPLYFTAPGLLQWWTDWWFYPLIHIEPDGTLPFGLNLWELLSLTVFAPVIEELLFRGVLLQTLAARQGLLPAALYSSLLFGLFHADPLGGMLFGLVMCALYVRSGSLWVPIACHALYNLVVWLWDLAGVYLEGDAYYHYELQDILADWVWAPLWLLGALIAMDRLIRHGRPAPGFTLPALPVSRHAEHD